MNTLPITPPSQSPAETVRISPENLEIANCYLGCQSIPETAENLGITTDIISEVLSKREVKAYIDNVFLDFGYNNRFKVRQIMDAVISKKLQDMDEADIGSDKDILDIMALNHKMAMDHLAMQIKLEEARAKNTTIKNQTNVQINGEGSKYDNLIERLMRGDK